MAWLLPVIAELVADNNQMVRLADVKDFLWRLPQ